MTDFERTVFHADPSIIVERAYAEAVLAPSGKLVAITEDGAKTHWEDTDQKEMIVPAGYVGRAEDVYLSGHGCIWKNDKFVSLDSYVSFVAEIEARNGSWQTPWTHSPTRTIELPAAIGFSAGYGCFGHWLVDDIPRLGLLRSELGPDFHNLKIVLPIKTPNYAKTMLHLLLGITEDNLVYFDHEREMILIKNLVLASYPHGNYNFNPFVRDFYASLVKNSSLRRRRFCLSRRSWEKDKAQSRRFLERRIFEDMAKDAGFEILVPETMAFADQITCMAEASIVIGEHGSAQHMSLFSPNECVIGTINPLTPVQTNLGRLYNNKNVILIPDDVNHIAHGTLDFSCSKRSLEAFFDRIESTSSSNPGFSPVRPWEIRSALVPQAAPA